MRRREKEKVASLQLFRSISSAKAPHEAGGSSLHQ